MNAIARVFFDCDMRCGFAGLHGVMRKAKMDPQTVVNGHVIFLNRAHTKMKILTGVYLTYYNNGSRKIPLTAIQWLPTVFGGREIDLKTAMTAATRKALEKQMHVRI